MSKRSPGRKPANPLLRFSTHDPDEFTEKISGIAPGLTCSPDGRNGMSVATSAAQLPSLGMFRSTFENFRVQSPSRSFYGVTIPLSGGSEFAINGTFEAFRNTKVHLQLPNKAFDARMNQGAFQSLQLCFKKTAFETIAEQYHDTKISDLELLESLDCRSPEVQSFTRYATFIWGEITRGGVLASSPVIATESMHMLGMLLASASTRRPGRDKIPSRFSPASIQRAEDYIMGNLQNPISIPSIAEASNVSVRTLSREFRKQHGVTIKSFIKMRRLELANKLLLAAQPGETNVTQVAMGTGFSQLGRFSSDYKQAFGELPSDTLTR